VETQNQLPVRLLDFVLGCSLFNAQYLVIRLVIDGAARATGATESTRHTAWKTATEEHRVESLLLLGLGLLEF
jgi:hypothetical protein